MWSLSNTPQQRGRNSADEMTLPIMPIIFAASNRMFIAESNCLWKSKFLSDRRWTERCWQWWIRSSDASRPHHLISSGFLSRLMSTLASEEEGRNKPEHVIACTRAIAQINRADLSSINGRFQCHFGGNVTHPRTSIDSLATAIISFSSRPKKNAQIDNSKWPCLPACR